MYTPENKGFTLVELSIVLIIIGLVTGAIVVGRAMIIHAELHKLVKEIEQYKTATITFREKYNCLPGDCTNATDWFGVSTTGCGWIAPPDPTHIGWILAAGGSGSCNGNGNGTIDLPGSGSESDVRQEAAMVFNHLSLAGLVGGSYDGMPHGGGCCASLQAGANVPYTIRSGGINLRTYYLGDASNTQPRNAFIAGYYIGRQMKASWDTDYSGGGLLTPEEAFSIDQKFDDGSPITGSISGGPWFNWGDSRDCMASPHLGGTYDTTKKDRICGLYFTLGL